MEQRQWMSSDMHVGKFHDVEVLWLEAQARSEVMQKLKVSFLGLKNDLAENGIDNRVYDMLVI